MVIKSTIPAKKLNVKAYISVKKNNAAKEPLMTIGCILLISSKRATGIPPNVVRPLIVPETIPVKILTGFILSFRFV